MRSRCSILLGQERCSHSAICLGDEVEALAATELVVAQDSVTVDQGIRHTSIHKAKGLDAKAVILIGLPPHRDLSSDYDHYSWFMAVSRARQLLAVVETAITPA